RPDRSQRRAWKANAGVLERRVERPSVSRDKLRLYDRFHAYQTEHKGWRYQDPQDPGSYRNSFVDNPFPTQEWCYFLGGRLVGVGYVDVLPAGLSAIYSFHDPDERHRSLGTYNILRLIDEAGRLKLPHVYLGYYVEGCPSMVYKGRFVPNQVRLPDGQWHDFRE